jgi:hypothetical protein
MTTARDFCRFAPGLQRPTVRLRCAENGAEKIRTRMFAAGKAYVARPGSGTTYEVTDEFGYTRVLVLEADGSARFIVGYVPRTDFPRAELAVFAQFVRDEGDYSGRGD